MAQLNLSQLTELRQAIQRSAAPVATCTKPQLNAAFQAVEDWFEANRAALSGVINTATAPVTLTPAQKVQIVKHWLLQKAGRE